MSDNIFSLMQSERGQKMMTYLPWYYEKSRLMHGLQDTNGLEIDWIRSALKDILNQFFVQTATWGLPYWESELGLSMSTGFPLELRRNIILAKLLRPPTQTRKNIERIVNQFVRNKTARVEMVKNSYRFFIVVSDDDLLYPSPMLKEISEVKPAHLAMYLTMEIWHQWQVHHRTEITQIVDAKQNYWNLGAAKFVRRDGKFMRDSTIRRTGIQPDGGYRTRQMHRAEIDLLVDTTMQNNGHIVNLRKGSHCRNGNHMRNGSYREKNMIGNYCTVTCVKNGMEVTEYV